MFPKKSKKSSGSRKPSAPKVDFTDLFNEAIDRNTSVGIVHRGQSGDDPLAQGRLLEIRNDEIVIEELQIIGRDVSMKVGDSIEGYLSYKGTMLTFEAKVLKVEMPRRLNEVRIVRALHISKPMNLRVGDRRSAFRASLSGLVDEVAVKIWFLDRYKADEEPEISMGNSEKSYYTNLLAAQMFDANIPLDEEGEEHEVVDWERVLNVAKTQEPHALGRLVDVTSNGLGILMYGISNMQLNRFERLGLSFVLEGNTLEFVVEVRQGFDIRGSTCRVGTLINYPSRSDTSTLTRRTLNMFAMQIQRDQLKGRGAA